MNRAQAIDRVVGNVMTGPLADYRRGLIDEGKLVEMTERRLPLIREQLREVFGRRREARCRCGAAATTQIAGIAYCTPHAQAAPRPGRPVVIG